MTDAPKQRNKTQRLSQALGEVQICTLDDLKDIPIPEKEIRVLVTVHSIKPLLGDIYVRGLGMWVGYIVQKYLQMRGIPHRFYMKSILTEGVLKTKPETLIKFLERNQIEYMIPSDVTDTMFLAEHCAKISPLGVKFAVTPNLGVYEMLENKWETFKMCKAHGISTPETVLFDENTTQEYPFFLKVASGTNAGRGVWHCENEADLKEALKDKFAKKGDILLRQTPTYGEIVCAEIIYNHGKPVGFFFAKSVQADDLAGMGKAYVFSQNKEYKQMHSHEKVELRDEQWEAVTHIFRQIGKATKYHGMIDIEFIIAGDKNAHAKEGSVWLLECNPRFSGDIHTTLSNPGFLDLYFDILNNKEGEDALFPTTNYSVGVEMKSRFGDFAPTDFYTTHPFKVLNIRHWNINNYHTFKPDPNAPTLMETLASTKDEKEPEAGKESKKSSFFQEYPDLDQKEVEDGEPEDGDVEEEAKASS